MINFKNLTYYQNDLANKFLTDAQPYFDTIRDSDSFQKFFELFVSLCDNQLSDEIKNICTRYYFEKIRKINLIQKHGLPILIQDDRIIVLSDAVQIIDNNNHYSFTEFTDITDLDINDVYKFLGY